ncbi:right-handed parallel beta-helix repeat-containing protein [Bacillus phage vB_BceS_LY1]|uniref:Right-handed parallel beta-helix repeat-containing protein n=1 Tax=Bacillus phage vB_BceS_LY1 TaxID=2950459 RepID=A0AAE9LUN9_9CAUD|nr:right-handed parallel beta-helix repeat-containing protein [Bacillus phage vB_BceS_LY1]
MANNIFKKKDVKLDTFEDLNCKGVIASFSQGDRISDKLVFRLTNDGVPLDLTDVVQVRIDFRKPDGKLVFQYCTIEDRPQGLVSCILTTQTLAAPGKVYAEVTAKYPEGKDAVTRQFTFHVEEAIAGDKSIESQNEWPMLERAIVAGDMLAGVDLVAIIKAGELAAGALPKAGGTMTGNIVKDRKLTTNSIYDQFITGATSNYFVGMSAAGKYHLYDDIAKLTPFEYDPVAKSFNVLSATNLVKKAGDTMTGPLSLNGAGASTKKFSFLKDGTEVFNLYAFSDTHFGVRDVVGNKNIWEYDTLTSSFNVLQNTNLVKKTGDTMTGDLRMEQGKVHRFLNVGNTATVASIGVNSSGRLYGWSDVANAGIFEYDPATKVFNLQADTNLVKKSGDTFTGSVNFDTAFTVRGSGASWDMRPFSGGTYSKGVRHTINTANNYYAVAPIDAAGAANWSNQMALYGDTGVLDVKDLNIRGGSASNVVTKLKDGRVNLNLTSDATNPVTSNPPRATRRGNTVTVQGSIKRNVGSTGTIVTTLPADMKPTQDSNITATATDGSAVDIFIGSNSGNISVGAADKHIQLFVTYVVD